MKESYRLDRMVKTGVYSGVKGPEMEKRAASILSNTTNRYAKRLRFASAIQDGLNITQASNAAGITRQTGRVWKRAIGAGEFHNAKQRDAALTKQETEALAAEMARNEEIPAPYRINAMSLSADLQGHKAPTRSIVEQHTVPASVVAWLDTRRQAALDVGTPTLGELTPPGTPQQGENEPVLPSLENSQHFQKALPATAATEGVKPVDPQTPDTIDVTDIQEVDDES